MNSFSTEHQTVRGRIAYVSDTAEDNGRLRGEERFTVTSHADGRKILRAACVINDPPHVVRDVVQTVDAAFQPLTCFVQIRTGGAPTGSGWFRWHDGIAACEADTAAEGRVSQTMNDDGLPRAFCNHAIVGDAWMAANHPRKAEKDRFLITNMFTPSLNKQGATGPTLARRALDIEYRGRDRITVPAGAFDVLAFAFAENRDHAPDYEMWMTDDGYFIPVLSMYRGRRRYELTEFERA
ncbi:MAG: hypothetical protein KDE14_01305 [Rhodobacteraceae bacterium]|nr:hypothetical protein [Paracoccaceae bacterium]